MFLATTFILIILISHLLRVLKLIESWNPPRITSITFYLFHVLQLLILWLLNLIFKSNTLSILIIGTSYFYFLGFKNLLLISHDPLRLPVISKYWIIIFGFDFVWILCINVGVVNWTNDICTVVNFTIIVTITRNMVHVIIRISRYALAHLSGIAHFHSSFIILVTLISWTAANKNTNENEKK